MDRVKMRFRQARKALDTLLILVDLDPPTAIERDAAIQRFEFSCELFWKACRDYLQEVEGLNFRSPKKVIRGLHESEHIDREESSLGLEMIDDRNRTVHTYNEELAIQIFKHLKTYADYMNEVLERLEIESG